MRNAVAHGYFKVDLEIVWKTASERPDRPACASAGNPAKPAGIRQHGCNVIHPMNGIGSPHEPIPRLIRLTTHQKQSRSSHQVPAPLKQRPHEQQRNRPETLEPLRRPARRRHQLQPTTSPNWSCSSSSRWNTKTPERRHAGHKLPEGARWPDIAKHRAASTCSPLPRTLLEPLAKHRPAHLRHLRRRADPPQGAAPPQATDQSHRRHRLVLRPARRPRRPLRRPARKERQRNQERRRPVLHSASANRQHRRPDQTRSPAKPSRTRPAAPPAS